jgi:hypothetical protein
MNNIFSGVIFFVITSLSIFPQSRFQVAIGGSSMEEGRSIIQDYDGGFVSAGVILSGQNHIYIVKISAAGQLLWTKTIGGANIDEAYSIIRTRDSGYAVTGYTGSFGAGNTDVIVIKLSRTGSVQWTKTFGGPNEDDGFSIIQNPDGSYVVGGSGTFGSTISLIIKLSENGDLLWSKTVSTGPAGSRIYSIMRANDEGYAFTGSSNNGVNVTRLDSTGSLLWSSIYKVGLYRDYGKSIIQTPDSGFVVTGIAATGFNARCDYYLIKFSKNGTMEWNRNYGFTYTTDLAAQVFSAQGGGYFVVGGSDFLLGNNADVHIVKYSAVGEVLWGRFIGQSAFDAIYSGVKTSDNGYVLAGATSSFGSGSEDLYILKLDSLWNSCGLSRDTLEGSNGPLGDYTPHTTTVLSQNLTVTSPSPVISSAGVLTINCGLTGVQIQPGEIPGEFSLLQNYPNPFNPVTEITFSIPEQTSVSLIIYNAIGEQTEVLLNEFVGPGSYKITWNAADYPSGIYYYSLKTDKISISKKMVLIK